MLSDLNHRNSDSVMMSSKLKKLLLALDDSLVQVLEFLVAQSQIKTIDRF